MKKWLKFFWLSFFSNETSKSAVKRGFSNFFLALTLALVILCAGFIGADILPFGTHYNNSVGFRETARNVFANEDVDKRISIYIENGQLKAKKDGGQFSNALIVNTFVSEQDRLDYSVDDCHVVIDTRSANALAEVEAYCVSTADESEVITYQEYLSLNDVAKLNFEFRLKYTGNELTLTDEFIANCKDVVNSISNDNKLATDKLVSDLEENRITKDEYNRAIYELYFSQYYPEISQYETSSKVPLLRNFYYHEYIATGKDKFMFVFDDYMIGSFKTESGIEMAFYGFYNNAANGLLIEDGDSLATAQKAVDEFIRKAYSSTPEMSLYIYIMNIIRLLPFIALMPVVVSLLVHSILKLKNIHTTRTFGGTFKVVGAYVWFSAVIASVITIILSFFVQRSALSVMPLAFMFAALMIRSLFFVIAESKKHRELLEKEAAENVQTENGATEA